MDIIKEEPGSAGTETGSSAFTEPDFVEDNASSAVKQGAPNRLSWSVSRAQVQQDLIGWMLRDADAETANFAAPLFDSTQFSNGSYFLAFAAAVAAHRDGGATTVEHLALRLSNADPSLTEQDAQDFLWDCCAAPTPAHRTQLHGWIKQAASDLSNASKDDKKRQADEMLKRMGVDALADVNELLRETQVATAISILSSGDFVRGFQPPDYIIDGVVQRGYVYSLTGRTGSGKTALALRILAHVGTGRPLAGHGVEQGTCLMFAGENPDDVRARWIALAEQMGLIVDEIPVHFIPGKFSILGMRAVVEQKARELGGLAAVLVDTSAVYYEGEDENDNVQIGAHARNLRSITEYPGHPAVIINCHPVKNASDEALVPRGGGAFIAEIDGNLTCRKIDSQVILHWHEKLRGPDFAPITFELATVYSEQLVDTKGRQMPTVYARPLTDAEAENREAATDSDLIKLIAVMAAKPGASVAEMAVAAGWLSKDGEPSKSRVHRRLATLRKAGLAEKTLHKWMLTAKGKKAVNAT